MNSAIAFSWQYLRKSYDAFQLTFIGEEPQGQICSGDCSGDLAVNSIEWAHSEFGAITLVVGCMMRGVRIAPFVLIASRIACIQHV